VNKTPRKRGSGMNEFELGEKFGVGFLVALILSFFA
jgi:hypothetical protein